MMGTDVLTSSHPSTDATSFPPFRKVHVLPCQEAQGHPQPSAHPSHPHRQRHLRHPLPAHGSLRWTAQPTPALPHAPIPSPTAVPDTPPTPAPARSGSSPSSPPTGRTTACPTSLPSCAARCGPRSSWSTTDPDPPGTSPSSGRRRAAPRTSLRFSEQGFGVEDEGYTLVLDAEPLNSMVKPHARASLVRRV